MKFFKNTLPILRHLLVFLSGFALPFFTYTFEEIKFVLLLITVTVLYAVRNLKKHPQFSKVALVILLGVAAGMPVRQTTHPEIEASLWARSSETTLSTKKLDSLIVASQIPQKIVKKKDIKEESKVRPRVISVLLAFLMLLVTYGFFYLTITAIFGSAFWFILFAILGIASLSGILYFLHRAFRKKTLKKRPERTKADNRKEWLIYLRIFLVMLGAGIALTLLSVTGAFY
jgi:uncharacterized membrane protein YuzA (DUF378 family)